MSLRRGAFLDRDGTIIEDRRYISTPEEVHLLTGAAAAIARLNAADVPVLIISNQSGIGRGLFTHEAYVRVQARVEALLREAGARIDGIYICPHRPDAQPPCECRKPRPFLYRQAAEEHGVDLGRSWFVGDRWHDVAVAESLGGEGILVPSPATPAEERERARRDALVMPSLAAAVERMCSLTADR